VATSRRAAWLAIGVAGGLVLAACGNSSGNEGASEEESEAVAVEAPGVTDDEIRVGGVASVTNPLGGSYGGLFEGVDAYFQMVNEAGGVHGRDLVLSSERDDQVANNDAAVQALLSQDDVFAVLPVASLLFAGADELVDARVPTFGWAINPEWQGTPDEPRDNLFGQYVSYLCFGCASPLVPFVANELEAERIGLLAYNVPQSAECATGIERSFDDYQQPATVAFSDKSLAFGATDLSAQVSQMKDANVDLVLTCMDLQGVVTLAREMKRQSLDAVQYLPNGYDPQILTEFGDLFQGSVVLTFFTPFEVEEPPEALEEYLDWMERTGVEPNENTMNGWLNAALFVEGLREAGPDFSREKVIDAINGLTDWDAGGLLPDVDWTRAHTEQADPVCGAISQIEGDAFVPVFGEPGKPFVCLDLGTDDVSDATPTA
jgi:ABC-type branched-subunit amino acid transport system substrate-binding protein